MKRFLGLFLLFSYTTAFSQIGGNGTYAFLNLTNSARVASFGGKTVSINDNDLNLVVVNPSLLNASMHNNLVMNYVSYISDIKFGYAAYAYNYDAKNTFALGIQYINYGTFDRAEANGLLQGKFYASDNALNLIYSHKIDSNFTLGVNFKPIYSTYDSYTSFGFGSDVAATYSSNDRLFTGALVLRNIGTQITRYSEQSGYERLPFEIVAGISKKFEHAPIRIIITLQQLQKYKLNYIDSTSSKYEIDKFGKIEGPTKAADFGDNIMRHVIVGVELTPIKNFFFRLGYNYQRRKEMQIPDKIGTVGFSWGFGIRISKFNISYARTNYFLGYPSDNISIALNLSEFYHRR